MSLPPRQSKPAPAASRHRSKFWFVRIDGPHEFLISKCKQLSECIDVIAMLGACHVGEKKDNPHCHFVIELASEPQKQAFAVRLKGLFGYDVVTKSKYSLDIWDGRKGAGACSYLFHEDTATICVCKGFSDSDIESARLANQSYQEVIAVNKERASNKFLDKVYAHFKEDGNPSEYELLRYFLELVRSGEIYYPGEFRMKQLIQEAYIKISDAGNFTRFVDNMANKFNFPV